MTLPPKHEAYGSEYYRCCCGDLPYERRPEWLRFFGSIAENVVSTLHPKTVFDAGCAMGMLVESFWDRGVEACGVDVSSYAIARVRADMGPYCRWASLVEPIEGRFDLVTCIEVLEHIPEAECVEAVRNLTRVTDRILFSSTPSDLTEATHCNVRPILAWLQLFASFGFHADLGHDAGYVAPHAILLQRGTPLSVAEQVELASLLMARCEAKQQAARLEKVSTSISSTSVGEEGRQVLAHSLAELQKWQQETAAHGQRRWLEHAALLGRSAGDRAALEQRVGDLETGETRLRQEAADSKQAMEHLSAALALKEAESSALEAQAQQGLVELRRAEEGMREALLELQRVREQLRARSAAAALEGTAVSPAEREAAHLGLALRRWSSWSAAQRSSRQRLLRRLERSPKLAKARRFLRQLGQGLGHVPSATRSQARRIAPLVDEGFYFGAYPWAKAHGLSAAEHYLQMGSAQGLNPSPVFDTQFYLARYPEVGAAGLNPLVHYVEFGAAEDRDTHPGGFVPAALAAELRQIAPLVDEAFYFHTYPGARAGGLSAAEHYLFFGARHGHNPSPAFDTQFYLARNPDVEAAGVNPLLHFVACGAAEGRASHPSREAMQRAAAGFQSPGGSLVAADSGPQTALQVRGDNAPAARLLESSKRFLVRRHERPTTLIVTVHNALDDLRACLSSILRYTFPPYDLVLVDDGSASETREYLQRFAAAQDAKLIRNEGAKGYTCAANQGLRAAGGDYLVLLNSDTVVGHDWLDRMVMCAESDPRIGLVGPLSNTASWQSIPEVEENGDWAANRLPGGWSVQDMARSVAAFTGRTYPRMSFLNGFCLLIKRQVIADVGCFDEERFGQGYGEENDYCLRARAAGWHLAVADDTYVHHAQGKSYSNERRKQLYSHADRMLHEKHDAGLIQQGVRQVRDDLVLLGLRARAGQLFHRRALIDKARRRWEGKRVAFLLPVDAVGGGANVVLAEARAMQRFGIDVLVVNLRNAEQSFRSSYPDLGLRLALAASASDVPDLVHGYDAVVATAHHTVFWLVPLLRRAASPRLGYYIQDYEPHFFPPGTAEYLSAQWSYTAVPDIVRFTKTAWNRDELQREVGVDSIVVGPSCDVDLFRPRPVARGARLGVCAMVRPSSPRRAPRETMELLAEVDRRYGPQVDIHLFGVEPDDPLFLVLPRNFRWRSHGVLTRESTAALLSTQDIFLDLSRYQAMGLTAMEAMASGAAVVVPLAGGAASFAVHQRNALVVDTASPESCLEAVASLIEDEELRTALRRAAVRDIVEHSPERAAFMILSALFGNQLPERWGEAASV